MANAAIDMWAPILPVPEMMAHLRDNFPDLMLGYLRVFWKQQPTQEAVRARVEAAAQPLEHVMAAIDAAGIGKTLITGFDEATTAGGKTFVPNEIVAALAARHPDRFLPFAGADIMRGQEALRDFEQWVRVRGFRGLSLRPFMIGLPADDRHYYPFYAKCVELGVPIQLQVGQSMIYAADYPRRSVGRPITLDAVACDFPELTLIGIHIGIPWTDR